MVTVVAKRADRLLSRTAIWLLSLAVLTAIAIGIVLLAQKYSGAGPTPRETEGGDRAAAAVFVEHL